MQYRREWKHPITYMDMLVLRQRLQAVMRPDSHGADGRYQIRSLYFDTPGDTALLEKVNGVNRREKFRIRYYNYDTSFIRLEKKSKLAGLGNKQSAPLTARQTQQIVDGDLDWMLTSEHGLIRELYSKMRTQQLQPKTIVDYTREAFVYPPGNVRVTLDYDIRTGLGCTDVLNPNCPTIPAGDGAIILEVKWDEFLPDMIRSAIQLEGRRVSAFSKYAQCRIYG
jgi:hypothetical protein